jgi:hypothetical protein
MTLKRVFGAVRRLKNTKKKRKRISITCYGFVILYQKRMKNLILLLISCSPLFAADSYQIQVETKNCHLDIRCSPIYRDKEVNPIQRSALSFNRTTTSIRDISDFVNNDNTKIPSFNLTAIIMHDGGGPCSAKLRYLKNNQVLGEHNFSAPLSSNCKSRGMLGQFGFAAEK